MSEPRTCLDMMRDLVATVREREWMPGQVYSGDSMDPGCPECEAPEPVKEGEGHKSGCKTVALLTEAEAFIRVESGK